MRGLFLTFFICLLVIAGCSDDNDLVSEREQLDNQLNPGTNQNKKVDPDFDKRLGYVNYKKDQIDEDDNAQITVDRHALADMVTRVLLKNDAFTEVATLVTGNEVLIAYEKGEDDDDNDDEKTAEFARKTAISLLPRYFDIYVSDNRNLIDDLHSLHNQTTDTNDYQNTIDTIIQEMKKSPQGDLEE